MTQAKYKRNNHLLIGVCILSALTVLHVAVLSFLNIRSLASTSQPPPISLPTPPQISSTTPPKLLSVNYILVDVATNQILLDRGSRARIYPASITKLATALTALNIYPLDEEVTVRTEYKEGKVMGLKSAERITVGDLVTGLLVHSANDAAVALADHHPQGSPGFISAMNQLMAKYHLEATHFVNVDGIHLPNHYSSAYDLSQLGRLAIQNPTIRNLVRTSSVTVHDLSGTIVHPLATTNELLGKYPEIEGLKTGFTPEAGGCFVGLFNLRGHYLISVVAQSPDRFADTLSLLRWSQQNLIWN